MSTDGPAWPAPVGVGAAEAAALAAPRPARRGGWVRHAALVGALAVAGVPLGLLWQALAPDVPLRMTAAGPALTSPQPEQFAAADAWFTMLGAGLGGAAAVAAWVLLRRYRGVGQLGALVLGAVAAGVVAWWVGRQIGLADYRALLDSAAGTRLAKPADLRATQVYRLGGVLPLVRGDVLAPALCAATAYTLLAGWSRFTTLRRHEEDALAWARPAWPVLAGVPGADGGAQAEGGVQADGGAQAAGGGGPGAGAGPVSSAGDGWSTGPGAAAPPGSGPAAPPPG
ncbi:hypothetical protein GCM10010124_18090 [Pilimelia terevasa]|uniref:DUF2567 domain-containing protein n=1 Tax=Pilimelia terevasa TaxID=53372 RepID=A0A8J3BMX1_9ACTN|nr:DUF2567 domain-containing protein [Pilimelia terevasa]GGK25943.1 hypothetical protein GCM10010124_18090 [Pilimelia terevasa]